MVGNFEVAVTAPAAASVPLTSSELRAAVSRCKWDERLAARDCATGLFDPDVAAAIAADGTVDCAATCLYASHEGDNSFSRKAILSDGTAYVIKPIAHYLLQTDSVDSVGVLPQPRWGGVRTAAPQRTGDQWTHYRWYYDWGSALHLGSSHDLSLTAHDFTVMAWFHPLQHNVAAVSTLLQVEPDENGNFLWLGLDGKRPTMMTGVGRPKCQSTAESSNWFTNGRWTHVTFSYDFLSQTIRIYTAGVLTAECSGRLPFRGAGDVIVGKSASQEVPYLPTGWHGGGVTAGLNGAVRDLRFYDATIVPDDVIDQALTHRKGIYYDMVTDAAMNSGRTTSWEWDNRWCWKKSVAGDVCVGHASAVAIRAKSSSVAKLYDAYTFDPDLTPLVYNVSRPNGTTAGGTTVTIHGEGFGTDGVSVKLNGITCATEEEQIGEYRGQNLCEWGRIQREQGKGDMAVDCSALKAPTDNEITCITNAFPKSGGVPETTTVDVVVPDKGRAVADTAEWTYMNLWSRKTTWGGNDPPEAGMSVVVTQAEFIVLDMSPPQLDLIILQVRAHTHR
jgi:hypothetical protein